MPEGKFYPICVDLTGKKCLVVGGGETAERKVKTLLEYGAQVSLVSPTLSQDLERLADEGLITVIRRCFEPSDLGGCFLVVGATDRRDVNREVAMEAQARGILCNIVDNPELCNFIVPSVLQRGGLQIAISTGGRSPALSRAIRERLEREFGEEYGRFVELLGDLRRKVKEKYPGDEGQRRRIWRELVRSDIPDLIRQGEDERVEEMVSRLFKDSESKGNRSSVSRK